MHITYSESFAGIGAWGKAIQRVTQKHNDTCELKFYYEFDKFASNSFAAIHEIDEKLNKWDITIEAEKLPEVDVFFYSPPCQTFSIAGKREGVNVDKGNLFYHAVEKIEKSNPKYCIMENVKGLPSGDTYRDFINMLWYLESKGYYNYWKILNSKDYGIPQNRERVFVVSIRSDLYSYGNRFEFPNVINLGKITAFDYLEDKVDESFYFNEDYINKIKENHEIKKGKHIGDYRFDEGFRIRHDKTCPCLMASNKKQSISGNPLIIINQNNNVSIRTITPLESFRLQGFDDSDYYKAVKSHNETFLDNNSDNKMYMRAGNSITVNVIEEILENLLYQRKQEHVQLSLF